jgi:branched-chain amino acid transport system ATP-binding protein
VLELTGISKSFGAIVVANDINLRVNDGEALGIIGPNGAGKSTLFNILTGLVRADSGQVVLDGVDITLASPEERCRAGLGRSFQIPQPFSGLTVYENLCVAALFGAGVGERDVVSMCGEILSLMGLEAKANVLAGRLPLLDRKRLELARALATRPKILLLDEIAGGLTDAECDELLGMINDIRSRGIAIVWVEHVTHALLKVVDRLIALESGRIIAQGRPADVMSSSDVQRIYMGVLA